MPDDCNGGSTDRSEGAALRARVAELEIALREQARLLDLARDAIIVRHLDGTITSWNRGAEQMYGHAREKALGKKTHQLLGTGFPQDLEAITRELVAAGHWEGELLHTKSDGSALVIDSRWVLHAEEGGRAPAVLEINTDITQRKAAEAERARQQQELIRAQALAIAELSTPLIPITDEILVMPLVGVMDSRRASQVMDSLLGGLASSRGEVAIIDVTGVAVVDTQVANALVRAAHAVRLLGAEVVLTGIRPDVAHTLVTVGADLGGIATRSTLQGGIAYALGRRRGNGSSRAAMMQSAPAIPSKTRHS